ncbi:MAG: 50S ribosomal protein L25 [Anaerolineae bacterium]|nr:50S ribosomal protein L25 [Promineifilum sp.]MCZ2114337.1 50S ribosomal protein L25 [Anaerolineae bacterium]HNS38922.1 50S ribosomal protein L25 [Promineifilum sp.]
MSERIVIEAEPREIIGKGVGQLRREGWIPGVVYGRQTPVNVQMEQKALRRALRVVGTVHLADLAFEGGTRTVLVREIQQHATRGDIVHVDFMEVDMKAKLTLMVELVGEGEAQPEADGLGVVTMMLHEVEIECLPDDLVASIHVDLSAIQTPEDVIHVKNLVAPKGIEILSDPDLVIARFEYAALGTEEEGEEEGGTVEVITKGKKEEEEF